MCTCNPLLAVDSYKASHWKQLPPGTTKMHSYISPRGGQFDHAVFFGLQHYLMGKTLQFDRADVKEAAEAFDRHDGTGIFPENQFMDLIDNARNKGVMPLRIRAIPEGTIVPIGTPVMTVENTDPRYPWLPGFVETALLRAVWYPTTVATLSWSIKQIIRKWMEITCDNLDGLDFKLHDFGARGVSSADAAAIGGLAHLVNFNGSDTMEAEWLARRHYFHGYKEGGTAGLSIPASEHSTITSWGRENEYKAFENMIEQFGKPGAMFACVSDSYNIFDACTKGWASLKEKLINSGSTLVVRPDSGDPNEVVPRILRLLQLEFGGTLNSKGYTVLPPYLRVIQGDGMNIKSIDELCATLMESGWSIDNVAFGCGGGLLQAVTRDTMKWAMKASAAEVNGEWIDVYKDPITDPGKASIKGRVDNPLFRTVYVDGQFRKPETLTEIRERARKIS